MTKLVRNRLLICALPILVLALSSTASAGLFDLFGLLKSRPKSKTPAVVKQSILVFPLDQAPSVNVPANYGEELASYLQSVLSGTPRYSVLVYRERLAPIKRAKDDNSLKTQDVVPPFSEDKAKALKLAQTIASDLYLVGTVEDYQFDASKKIAQLTLSAQLMDTKTGKLLGQYLVTGTADETCKATEEAEFRAVAAGKAVESLRDRIIPPTAPPAGEQTTAAAKPVETAPAGASEPEPKKEEMPPPPTTD